MSDPTLTKGSGTFFTSSTAILTLYNTQTEGVTKSANLINLPMPTGDSDEIIVFDLLGVTRELKVRGRFTTSDGTINNFAKDLNSLVAGKQGDTGGGQVGYDYTPQSTGVKITVYVNTVSWDFVAGEPNSLDYNISLIEAGSNSG